MILAIFLHFFIQDLVEVEAEHLSGIMKNSRMQMSSHDTIQSLSGFKPKHKRDALGLR